MISGVRKENKCWEQLHTFVCER